MSDVLDILTRYHADKISKQQAAVEIEELIDAERMGLRDEIAMRAMQAMITSSPIVSSANADITCGAAYLFSDKMLAERAK